MAQKDISEKEDCLNQYMVSANKAGEAEGSDIRKAILLRHYAIDTIMDSLMSVIRNEVRLGRFDQR